MTWCVQVGKGKKGERKYKLKSEYLMIIPNRQIFVPKHEQFLRFRWLHYLDSGFPMLCMCLSSHLLSAPSCHIAFCIIVFSWLNCGPLYRLSYGLDGPGSNAGGDEIFPPVQTGPGAHPASCTMGTGSFPGVKCGRGRAADHSHPSSAAVMEQYSYTSTHTLGHTGPVTGRLLSFYLIKLRLFSLT